jgi:hypothetical protein
MLTAGPHIRFLERHTRKKLRPPVVATIKAYRSLTRQFRVLPDFLIIGARKCGTTSLYEYLTQHPDVLPALSKELFYFDHHYEKGTNWYRRHFPTRVEKWVYEKATGNRIVTGEATPSYFYHPNAARRIAEALPQVKLILLLREPVAAAYSAYQFGIKMGTYTAQEVVFHQVIQDELSYIKQGGELFCRENGTFAINPRCTYLARHAYIELIRPWLEVFDRSQIKIILSEDLFTNPARVCKEVQEFLGLPIYELDSYKQFNQNGYHKLEPEVAQHLEEFFAPFNDRLGDFLGRNLNWQNGSARDKSAPANLFFTDEAQRQRKDFAEKKEMEEVGEWRT